MRAHRPLAGHRRREHGVLTSRPARRGDAAPVAELGASAPGSPSAATSPDALARLVADVEVDGPPIRRSCTVAGPGLRPARCRSPATDLAGFAAGVHVKLAGTANLDRLFDRADLDAFVLYSSVAAVWGAADHAAYAAGNAYLDAVTRARRARGLAGTTIAWGIWSGGGMGRDVDAADLKWRGLPFMAPDVAIAGLRAALADDEEFLTVADVDWERFVPVFTAARPRPLLDDVPEVRAVLDREASPAVADPLADRLRTLSAPDRDAALRDLVRQQVAAVLGRSDADGIDDTRPFRDLGFDSLLAVGLRNALGAATGLKLATTLVFDYPTVGRLAEHLHTTLFGAAQPAAADPTAPATGDPDDHAVAIVGMGCRFPGDVAGPEELWRLLRAGQDAVGEFPDGRGWHLDELYSPDPDAEGKVTVRTGGFVHDAGHFDPAFFGISPREAVAMDPQQRLLLETSWEAIEHGRIDPADLRGSSCGVFVGAAHSGYGSDLRHLPEGTEGHLVTGTVTSIASGRIAYTLGLEGPAVTLDTGCSSALVALHLAVRALRSGECAYALAGAASVVSSPLGFLGFSRQRGLAADGRCKAFAEDADGMGFAEGAGMLLLERLSDARRNGHRVLAVIRGSAVNQDGASNGLTAPNGPAQQRVIRAALADAGLTTSEVDAVEAHGTGTPLGDPIEAQALLATYGQDRDADRPLWLGSVKSNIGHTQIAAGAAGLMKIVLALRHQLLPRTLHVAQPSSRIDWSAGAVRLLAEEHEWPAIPGRPRRAGVSSFGVSGTNAHVIVEEAPAQEPAQPAPVSTGPVPWLLSGRSVAALRARATELVDLSADPVDVGWSLLTSRSSFEHRAVVLDGDAAGLAAVADGVPADGVVSGVVSGSPGRVVLVFPGQGAQWAGMGVELAAASPVFAARLAECETALSEFVDWSLTAVLRGDADAPSLDRVDVVQPASWAVMVSLAAAWESFGVRPAAVVGHSQGEIAAACVAGALSLTDGARVIALRSRLLAGLAGSGGMAALGLPPAEAEELLTGFDGVYVAAVNGPRSVVLSGDRAALDRVGAECARREIRFRLVPVDYASHSPAVDDVLTELRREVAAVRPQTPRVPLLSTVTGDWVRDASLDADYWCANLRRPVRFADAVRTLAAEGFGTYVEASPHPVLTAAVEETLDGHDGCVVGSLRRDDGGPRRFLLSLAEAWVRGAAVDWTAAFPAVGARTVDLPTYPFQRQHYWLTAPAGTAEDRPGDPADAEFWAAVERDDPAALAATLGIDAADSPLPQGAGARRLAAAPPAVRHGSWRYDVTWRPVRTAAAPRLDDTTWLLLLPEGDPAGAPDPWSTHLRRQLEDLGARVHQLTVTGDRATLAERLRADGVRRLCRRPSPCWRSAGGPTSTRR
nr:acyltransferase domain-containing protein [Micromonospora sp. R77]